MPKKELSEKEVLKLAKLEQQLDRYVEKKAPKVNMRSLKDAPVAKPFGRVRIQKLPFCGGGLYLHRVKGVYKKGIHEGSLFQRWKCTDSSEAPQRGAKSTKGRAKSPKTARKNAAAPAAPKTVAAKPTKKVTFAPLPPSHKSPRAKVASNKASMARKFTKDQLIDLAQQYGKSPAGTREQIINRLPKSAFA